MCYLDPLAMVPAIDNLEPHLIEVENLTKIFQDRGITAVDAISFHLPTGKVGCLIGTSGCGKTTTLKMINRLIEPTQGLVRVAGQEFHQKSPVEWRRKIGYVIQKAGLLPHMTVRQNISLLSRILGRNSDLISARVRELMETINMPFDEFAHLYPAELSGGQQQRVGVARALMEDPPVLLMDEPFGALDPITRESLHEEFINLNRRLNKTILMVTHDLEEAFKLGDIIILMDSGRIVQMGTKEQLLENPTTDFVRNFVKGKSDD